MGLDLHTFLEDYFFESYPSQAISLLEIYRNRGSDALVQAAKGLVTRGNLEKNALLEVSDELLSKAPALVVPLLTTHFEVYPESATAHYLIGIAYIETCQYALAGKHLGIAKAKGFDIWNVDDELAVVQQYEADLNSRKDKVVTIHPSATTRIEAEGYNNMCGIKAETTQDEGGGQNVGWLDSGDWMRYNVQLQKPGKYLAGFRVASWNGSGTIQVYAQGQPLAQIDVPKTDGWQSWTTVQASLDLPADTKTIELQIEEGGFNFNWISIKAHAQPE